MSACPIRWTPLPGTREPCVPVSSDQCGSAIRPRASRCIRCLGPACIQKNGKNNRESRARPRKASRSPTKPGNSQQASRLFIKTRELPGRPFRADRFFRTGSSIGSFILGRARLEPGFTLGRRRQLVRYESDEAMEHGAWTTVVSVVSYVPEAQPHTEN